MSQYGSRQRAYDDFRAKLEKPTLFERVFGLVEPNRIRALHELEAAEECWKESREQEAYDAWFANREFTENDLELYRGCKPGGAIRKYFLHPLNCRLQRIDEPPQYEETGRTLVAWPNAKEHIPKWFKYYMHTGVIT
jgi:hypothetical protein